MIRFACISLMLVSLLGSCNNDDLNIGAYITDTHTRTVFIDTLTVKLSTLAIDSIVTSPVSSRKNIGFFGCYNDPEIGMLSTRSFIEFSRNSTTTIDKYARYDSVTLELNLNGSYYGDTLKHPAFKVSQLVKPIIMQSDGRMYSTSSVPIGQFLIDTAFRVKASKNPTIEIKLPNDFGEKLFYGVMYNEDYMIGDSYLRTFPGLAIEPGAGSASVYGFNISDSTCRIRVYYHENSTHKVEKVLTFGSNPNNYFYNLKGDRIDDLKINSKDDPKPSSKTSNKAFVMSGTPLYTRMEFPYLNNFDFLGEIVLIQKASLIIHPVHHSFDTIPLPPELNLYYHDPTSSSNLNVLQDSNQKTLTGNLPSDYRERYHNPSYIPYYEFDITSFVAGQLGKTGYDKWALSLTIPTASEHSLQRLVLGDQHFYYNNEVRNKDNQVQLRITYTTCVD